MRTWKMKMDDKMNGKMNGTWNGNMKNEDEWEYEWENDWWYGGNGWLMDLFDGEKWWVKNGYGGWNDGWMKTKQST